MPNEPEQIYIREHDRFQLTNLQLVFAAVESVLWNDLYDTVVYSWRSRNRLTIVLIYTLNVGKSRVQRLCMSDYMDKPFDGI